MKLYARSQSDAKDNCMLGVWFVLPEPGPMETAWDECTITVTTSAEDMTGEAG